jgi:hypothetical protein
MPRRPQGPRLYWRERADGSGVYEIRDSAAGSRIRVSTGTDSRPEAETALQEYIAQKHRPSGPARPEELTVGQVLELYAIEHAPHTADPSRIGYAIEALAPFWGGIMVSEVKSALCRRYAAQRVSKRSGEPIASGTIRRELGTLQAALVYASREGHLIGTAPTVTLPRSPTPRSGGSPGRKPRGSFGARGR